MAIKDAFKVNRKTFFNPKAWIDYDILKDQTKTVFGLFKAVFAKPTAGREETFEEAKKRLNLTEEDINEARKNYLFFALIFAVLGVGLLALSFYFLFTGHLLGFLLGIAVCALLFAQAFRNHFF